MAQNQETDSRGRVSFRSDVPTLCWANQRRQSIYIYIYIYDCCENFH
jgi:hypothetical protein